MSLLYYVLLYCGSTALLLFYRVVGGYIVSFLSCVAVVGLLSCVHKGLWVFLFSFSPATYTGPALA